MKLTSQNVNDTLLKCLYREEEITRRGREVIMKEAKIVKGLQAQFGLKPSVVEEQRENIESMLMQLPPSFFFREEGESYVNAVVDGMGKQWTDFHQRVDELICLGLAIDAIKFAPQTDYEKQTGLQRFKVTLEADPVKMLSQFEQ
jgi:hypothetical protein